MSTPLEKARKNPESMKFIHIPAFTQNEEV